MPQQREEYSQYIGSFADEEAEHLFGELPFLTLLTRYTWTEIDFPGEDQEGFLVFSKAPMRLAEFSFSKRAFLEKGWCSLKIEPPRSWHRPAFLVNRYFKSGKFDKLVVTSQDGRIVELTDLKPEDLFSMSVKIEQSRHKPYKREVVIAKSNQKPRVMRKFLDTYQLPITECTGTRLLEHNLVEEYLRYLKQRRSN